MYNYYILIKNKSQAWWDVPVVSALGRLRWGEHFSPGIQDQPWQCSETPSQKIN
jgi:hypothetical protein